MDLQLQDPGFWASLHGQVPGLLDWDMGNECFLSFTTSHLPLYTQNREWGRGGGARGGGAASSGRAARGFPGSPPGWARPTQEREWWPFLRLGPLEPAGPVQHLPPEHF